MPDGPASRSERDSNPRYRLTPYAGLANRCLQPLGHRSRRITQSTSRGAGVQPSDATRCKSSRDGQRRGFRADERIGSNRADHNLGCRPSAGRDRRWPILGSGMKHDASRLASCRILIANTEGTGLEPVSGFHRGGFQDRCLTNSAQPSQGERNVVEARGSRNGRARQSAAVARRRQAAIALDADSTRHPATSAAPPPTSFA
jgi:hypothetical protein